MPTPLASQDHGDATAAASPVPPAGSVDLRTRAARSAQLAILGVLAVLFVELLLEAWVQELLGSRTVDENGLLVGYLPDWPKDLKNGLLILAAALSALKITLERRWREFGTRTDIALVVLALIMVLAGLLGTSGPVLIGEALFVYLRGAIVFYAVRALQPTWEQVRSVLWIIVPLLGANILVAAVQAVAGEPAYSGLGWVDMQWAQTNRAMGLLDHPNHLGHVLALVLIGLIAWISGQPRVSVRWWLAVGAAALGMAVTQSRESVLATLGAAVLIWFLRRGGIRPILACAAIITVMFGGYTLARPGNLTELLNRFGGVTSAVDTPSGNEDCEGFETNRECVEAGKVEKREIRLLFFQQGARLLADRPVLGYGVGQFGGIVAEKNDPNWELDPRFPGGFDLYDFDGTTVDSFWLHLVVETGVVGLLSYLAWLALIVVPLLGVTRRFAGRRVWGSSGPRAPAHGKAHAVALWGIGVMLLSVVFAVFSPALEDAIYPPLAFAILGLAWAMTREVGAPEGDD